MHELIASRSSLLKDIFRRHKVSKAYLVGSMARGDADDASDVDFIIRGAATKELRRELESALGRAVDIVDDHDVVKRIRQSLAAEQIKIFDESAP